MTTYGAHLRDRVKEIFGQGRWLCLGILASGARQMSKEVAEVAGLGPDDVMGLAVYGGDDPDQDSPYRVTALNNMSSGDFVTDLLRAAELIRTVSDESQAVIDAWDPTNEARALVAPFMTAGPIVRRATFGARPRHWARLEDKLAIGDLWASVGVPVAPSRNVSLTDGAGLMAAHRALASGPGSVWAADNSQGVHGGASGTRWVGGDNAVQRVGAELRQKGHQQVRIMPFLVGVPCSIHGVVLDGRTVALRPNEMLIFVEPDSGKFRYARAANYWDPEPARRTEMAEITVAIGEEMRRSVDFRGVFTIDGVMTADGFRPTEVNPRYGVALRSPVPTGDGGVLDLFLLNLAVVEEAMVIEPDRFEQWLVPTLDGNRGGGAVMSTGRAPDAVPVGMVKLTNDAHGDGLTFHTIVDQQGTRRQGLDDPDLDNPDLDNPDTVASIRWAPNGTAGGMMHCSFGAGCPIGPPTAPLLARVLALADEQWGCDVESLIPAAEVG